MLNGADWWSPSKASLMQTSFKLWSAVDNARHLILAPPKMINNRLIINSEMEDHVYIHP